MATYQCNLNNGQLLYIQNQGLQTQVTLVSATASQQQSISSSFQTGKWRVTPTVFRTTTGVVIQIPAENHQHFIQVQAQAISLLHQTPSLNNSQTLSLQQVETEANPNLSMPPMEPMRMGDMQMSMEPMEMRMGNMEMRMGTRSQLKQETGNFCPQCSTKVEVGDRFCSACGERLAP